MQLFCCGDVAITERSSPGTQWMPIGNSTPGVETCILFNWELPIGQNTNPIPRSSGPRLLSLENSVNVIKKWSPGLATLATNHIMDAGEGGLAATISALHQAGFQTVGAGVSAHEINQPFILETNDGRLGIINWVFPETHPEWEVIPGPNCWPGLDIGQEVVCDLKSRVDWVLIFPHWSDELFPYPSPADREIAWGLVQAGADMIIGHHPHVVRGLEVIDGKPVYYSVGNFYFSKTCDQKGNWIVRPAPRNREALVVKVTFERFQAPRCEVLPYWQGSRETTPDPFQRAVRRMKQVSKPLAALAGDSYLQWYIRRHVTFDRWEHRIHFSLWQKGWKEIIRYPFSQLAKGQRARKSNA